MDKGSQEVVLREAAGLVNKLSEHCSAHGLRLTCSIAPAGRLDEIKACLAYVGGDPVAFPLMLAWQCRFAAAQLGMDQLRFIGALAMALSSQATGPVDELKVEEIDPLQSMGWEPKEGDNG